MIFHRPKVKKERETKRKRGEDAEHDVVKPLAKSQKVSKSLVS